MTELPDAVVVSAAHIAAELIRRCHRSGQPVPRGVLPTLDALTRAVANPGHIDSATDADSRTWVSTSEFAQLTGIPARSLRRNATRHGGRKVGSQWTFPTTS